MRNLTNATLRKIAKTPPITKAGISARITAKHNVACVRRGNSLAIAMARAFQPRMLT